ncbi:MAG: DMSO/selenate family reductase complex B subunit [bacterium]
MIYSTRQLAFYIDTSACSGCKACQIACKDKNHLPMGVLWRRVYEVSGGGWEQSGAAWTHDVFAYTISLSCNHCEHPICVGICPTTALTKRDDGIVFIDAEKCMGCRYCSWACPYGALQFNEGTGQMTKCNFCMDRIDAGLPPSCVAACPMRVLDYGEQKDLEARYGDQSKIYPLPERRFTEPALCITPHRDSHRASVETASLANEEEVKPL